MWLQHNDPEIRAAIWLQVAFQARSSFAKGNPFSFFSGPLFWGPLVVFFLFFLSPAKVGSLEMHGAKLQAYLGVVMLQPHACAQRFRFQILRRTRSFPGRTSARSLPGGIEPIWETPSKKRFALYSANAPLVGCHLSYLAASAFLTFGMDGEGKSKEMFSVGLSICRRLVSVYELRVNTRFFVKPWLDALNRATFNRLCQPHAATKCCVRWTHA